VLCSKSVDLNRCVEDADDGFVLDSNIALKLT
jgi:hypothetical protein